MKNSIVFLQTIHDKALAGIKYYKKYFSQHKKKCVRLSAGQFWTGLQCQSCHDSCETCSESSDQDCLSCRSPTMFQSPGLCVEQCSAGYFPDLRFGNYATCQPCPHPCIECVSRTNCTMCHSPLLLQTGQCRTTCAPGYVDTFLYILSFEYLISQQTRMMLMFIF